jgi:hypothetical protein
MNLPFETRDIAVLIAAIFNNIVYRFLVTILNCGIAIEINLKHRRFFWKKVGFVLI